MDENKPQDKSEAPKQKKPDAPAPQKRPFDVLREVNPGQPEVVLETIPGVFESLGVLFSTKRGTHEYYTAEKTLKQLYQLATGKILEP
jgi:hypothetical protein